MARTYFCPRCLDDITPEQVQYRTRNGEQTMKPHLPYNRGVTEWAQAIWRGDPRPLYQFNPAEVANLHATGTHAQCPNGHRIPDKAFDIPSLVVGMVGEPAAGKTVFLGTLLSQLDRGRLLPYLDFHLDERSEEIREELFEPFYRDGSLPGATVRNQGSASREAITLTAREAGLERFYLSMFDTSGEQGRLADHGTANKFMYVADVVMFFITPQALSLPHRTARVRDDQRQYWHTTNALIQAAVAAATGARTHAAVILIKSDDIDPDYLDILKDARDDLRYGDGLTLLRAYQVIEQDSDYIRQFMRSFDDGRTLADRIEDGFSSVTYHLVSATGGPPDPVLNRFVDPRPQRVLDPLLAALVQTGMLDARDGRQALR